jgi:hypothetical protein
MSEVKQISDKEAVSILNTTRGRRAQPANKFVTRTIVYPVTVFYKAETPTVEIRSFVRQNEYCSPAQWDKALELEKEYPELQKQYRAMLKAKGIALDVREPGNPLKATVIELNK